MTSHALKRDGIIFLFIDPTPPQAYPLSLHDALPIFRLSKPEVGVFSAAGIDAPRRHVREFRVSEEDLEAYTVGEEDRKSTRLNSSHVRISYAVFCLKKKTWTKSSPATKRASRTWSEP